MTDTAIRDKIQDALNQCGNSGDFVAAAGDLLKALEYESDRRIDGNGDARQFIATFRAPHKNTHSEKRFVDAVASVRIVFQFAESEISRNLFAGQKFDQGMIKSFLFFAVILRGEKYGRHQYAEFTREINKRFAMPAVVLFLCRRNDAARLTLAFAGRRPSISDSSRQVLQKISLLREIKCDKTHQGHLRILEQLTFSRRLQWMTDNKLEENFDGLLAAWLDELDAEALNKRFYQDLLRWFNATVQIIKIPAADKKQLGKEAFVIRLINRVLFIWFLKEKGLVEPKLFIAEQIGGVLKDYTPANGDSYYRAVLQNLFFATLNTKTGDRQFRRDDSNTKAYDEQHRDFALRRYAKLIAQPEVLTAWLDKTPFVNGGLFDCLDGHKSKSQGGGGRVDCFSDNPTHQKMLSIPNRVFFGEKEGGGGLFDILNKYKFTVEENTPIEQEVALDPELLGKTFENLLIYIDRKETGSYYTPRPIVEFMVRESLLAYFVRAIGANDADQKRLRALLSAEVDYENLPAKQKLTKDKIKSFIDAASDLKLLDPAVGSGAFPMGALMVLTMALKRIDPKNAYLREREMQRANRFEDSRIRTEARQVVEEVFSPQNEHNHYGRKLSLIRDCIYGVDIQPMAVQICRLRFFISLAIEQKTDYNKPNFGIRPLPNLETKIIAADTLVKIQPADLFRSSVRDLENELMDTRRDFFTANDRTTKNKCRKKDEVLRQKIKETLCSKNYPAGDGNKISSWDLYDQTTTADWFDPAWMFGVHNGFDVVLGNPPYAVSNDKALRKEFSESVYGRPNLYGYFIHKSIRDLTKTDGILAFINPKTLLTDAYFSALRKWIMRNTAISEILNITDRRNVFDSVIQSVIVNFFQKNAIETRIKNISDKTQINSDQHIKIKFLDMLYQNNNNPIFLVCENKLGYKIFNKLSKFPSLSDSGFEFVTGKIQWDKFKNHFSATKKKNCIRLIWAENIQRYYVAAPRLRGDKLYLTSEWEENALIEKSTIIVQRTTAVEQPRRIIASLVSSNDVGGAFASENHTSYMSHYPSNKYLVLCLGLLLSKLHDFTFRHINSNTQVSAGELNSLPFIIETAQNKNAIEKICCLVDKILALKRKDCTHDTSTIESEIDKIVYTLYGLTDDEILLVESEYKAE